MAKYQNQATLLTADGVALSNIVQGEVSDILSVTKRAVMPDYVSGDEITYVVSLVNGSANTMTGLTVTDNLGSYTAGTLTLTPLQYVPDSLLYYQNGVLQPSPVITVDEPLTIPNINVPANGNATLIYEMQTNAFAPLGVGGKIENTVSVEGSPLPAAVTASETSTVEEKPQLSISKLISPVPVSEGSSVTYTFIIQNRGNVATSDETALIVSDTFDPPLSITGVQLDDATFTDYSYLSGTFSTTAASIVVPAATITQDPTTGIWLVSPGSVTLVVTGTL